MTVADLTTRLDYLAAPFATGLPRKNMKPLKDRAPPQFGETHEKDHVAVCYVIFAVYAAVLYGVSQKALYELDQKIVPSGDAMTYAAFFFRILDEARHGVELAITFIVQNNYNWLQDGLVLLFSPAVYNERSSLIIINFAAFLFSTILVFRTALLCKVPPFFALCAGMLFVGMPWFYNMHMEFNLTSLMLDTIYFCAYLCVCIFLARFISAPYSKRLAIVAGLAVGLTIWSRWNAIINLSMPVAGFGLVAVIRLIFSKKMLWRPFLGTCAIFAAICLAFAAIYFGLEYRPILQYGLEVAHSSSFDWPTKIAGAQWLLLNVPGLAIAGRWFYPNTLTTPFYAVALTIFAHVLVIYSAASGVRKILSERQDDVLISALGLIGATIFYLDLLLAITTFGGFYARFQYRNLHFIEPALVGLICCALSTLCGLLARRQTALLRYVNYRIVCVLIAVLVALNSVRIVRSSLAASVNDAMWTSAKVTYGLPEGETEYAACRGVRELPQLYLSTDDLKAFAVRLHEAAVGKLMYFFWYSLFNEAVMGYYLAQQDLSPAVSVYERTPLDQYVWYYSFTPKELVSETWFRDWLKYILAKADFIIIPENVNAFSTIWSSPIVAYHNDIVAAVNSPQIAPDYVVWGIIDESDTRVLVLKRHSAGSDDGLESFPRTWGTSAQVIGRGFKGARVVAARMRRPIDPGATQDLELSYKGYNIVRVGDLYVGVWRGLGVYDIRATLAKEGPPPPRGMFLVASNVASLERTIDDAVQVCRYHPSDVPVLITRYKGYNIVHVGQLYVGVDNKVGAIDVAAALANKTPRPPPPQFLLADSTVSLEAAIDRVAPNLVGRIFDRWMHALRKIVSVF